MAPVHDAALKNDVEALRGLLDAEPGLVNEEDEDEDEERGPLHRACQAGSLDAMQLLLDRGADIEKRGGLNGYTPLMDACYYGQVGAVALLLARGADPLARNNEGRTALTDASSGEPDAGSDHLAVLRLLFEDGRVPVDARDDEGWTALYWACLYGRTDRARVLLLEGRADHTIPRNDGMTPMDVAERNGRGGCVDLLQWYEGELEKAALLSKARAVADARECISKAAEKAGARTEAEAQRAREEAAPAYLRGRVERGEALPAVEVEGRQQEEEEDGEEECVSVLAYVVHELKEDLVVEMMEGLQLR